MIKLSFRPSESDAFHRNCSFKEFEIKYKKFPCGEIMIDFSKLPKNSGWDIDVKVDIECSDELIALWFICEELKVKYINGSRVLYFNYLPYERQDKILSNNICNFKHFSKLINFMNFDKVYVDDTHSLVANGALNNVISNDRYLDVINYFKLEDFIVVSPDLNAAKKNQDLKCKGHLIFAKRRCEINGHIEELYPLNIKDFDISKEKLIVIDDLCDGGATFIRLAKELKKFNFLELNMYVTHGIFTKGKSELYKYYDNIYAKYERGI